MMKLNIEGCESIRYLYCFRYKVCVELMRPHFGNLHHVTIDSWFTGPKLSHELKQWNGMPFSFFKARLPKERDCKIARSIDGGSLQ